MAKIAPDFWLKGGILAQRQARWQIYLFPSPSFADCCIAGSAKQKSAILVNKDPEFEQVEGDVAQMKLPYKSTRS